ncbi:hypothetical protein GCM10011428_36350 [Streptomyces violaceus]
MGPQPVWSNCGVPVGGVKPALGMEVTVAWSCTDGGPAVGGWSFSSDGRFSGGAHGSWPPPPGCVASDMLYPPWVDRAVMLRGGSARATVRVRWGWSRSSPCP